VIVRIALLPSLQLPGENLKERFASIIRRIIEERESAWIIVLLAEIEQLRDRGCDRVERALPEARAIEPVEGEFDESAVNEAADRAVRLIAVHLSGKRELIDDPLPGSVVLAASDFGGDGAVRESR
jgi:hypothetical protein